MTDVNAQLEAVVEQEVEKGRYLLLHEKYFTTERFEDYDGVISADPRRFALLTAVKDCRIAWADGEMMLPAGRTAFLPADGFDLQLQAPAALISYPTC